MQSNELALALAPFQTLPNHGGATPRYRVIELGPDTIRAFTAFSYLCAYAPLGLTQPVCVDRAAFLLTVNSLPSNTELKLSTQGDVLHWSCGTARGRLATVPVPDLPHVEVQTANGTSLPNTTISAALEYGSLSCETQRIGSDPLSGVMIDTEQNIVVCSTDNVTASFYDTFIAANGVPSATLSAHGAELLSSVLKRPGTTCVGDSEVTFYNEGVACIVKQISPLRRNPMKLKALYGDCYSIAALPIDGVRAFIKRATGLAVSKRDSVVHLSVHDGRIGLKFEEVASASEEYFISDDLAGFPSLTPVTLPAARLAKALSCVSEIGLDHLDRGVLVLRGLRQENTQAYAFTYIIAGTLSAEE